MLQMRLSSLASLVSRFGRWLAAALALSAALTGCGGGGGGGSSTPAAAVSPASLTITSFSPASGGSGTAIAVIGTGFTGLQSAKVGSVDAAFSVASDVQVRVTVPAGAQTGRIELSGLGRTTLSAGNFTVTAIPVVTAVSPTSVLAGGRVTLTGTGLDLVREVRLNATVLTIVSQTTTSLVVDLIAGATSGVLTLVDASGVGRPVAQQVTIVAPMTISSFSPASIVTGQTLTIDGTGLDRAVGVTFANGATANVATRSGSTRITVTVPDAATTGALRVRGNANDEVVSASPLTVSPAIRVDANAVYRVAAGANVSLGGTGLTEVSGVMVGATAATIVSRTATQLVFTVPAGIACGVITLQSTSQPAVAGGSVVVGTGCVATLAGIEFGQVLSQPASDPRQRLVPGKETWVRAFVVSNQSGLVAPTVRVTGYTGAVIRGTLTMSGPDTLPVVSGATVPDAIRYDEDQSFNAELPAAWVAAGLSVRIEVDPEQRLGAPTVMDATPLVGTSTRIDIVLVPVVSGSFVPTMPSSNAVLEELIRRFPIPGASISVSVRPSYTLSSVTDGLDTSSEWSSALLELRQLRDAENPGNAYRYYFGIVRRSGGSVAGIGYVPGRAALGWDSGGNWARTMTHEIGHNLGRLHAPCGSVASPDPNYPYAGGVLGPTPLVDSVPAALNVISPASQTDVMGYCNGAWFSDYNYSAMQAHLESQPQASIASAQATSDADLLMISGVIGIDGVSFAPVQALRGRLSFSGGDYTLRVITRDGRTIEHAFDAQEVDHVENEKHFALKLIDPGAIAGLEVLHGGARVALRASSLASIQRARTTADEPIALEWSETAGVLSVNWNAAARAYLMVAHVLDDRRTVLALNRTGGQLQLPTSDLPAGGVFELGLSDGVNAQRVVLTR